jgi:hypothetical protein
MTAPNSSSQIVEAEASRSLVPLIRQALASDVDPAKLRELLAVRREWEGDESRKVFNLAVSEFQRRCPIIEKADDANGKAYARLDRIWRETRPLLTELGLSVTWQVCELKRGAEWGPDGICHIEGMLAHKDGHGQRLVMDVPLPAMITTRDGRAVQNAAQQLGSAHTYAKRFALCAALGVVTGDDTDGNVPSSIIDPEEAREIDELLDACRGLNDFNEPAFWKWIDTKWPGVKTTKEIRVDGLADVLAMLKKKLGKMK